MVEYLAPGVYIEETSFRSKPIEGVATSTTAFVGLCRTGPINEVSEVITSIGDFERVYGGLAPVVVGGSAHTNYLAHAVRAFFDNGGARLYVSRVYEPTNNNANEDRATSRANHASGFDGAHFEARFSGSAGNGHVMLYELSRPAAPTSMANAPVGSMVSSGASSLAEAATLTGVALPVGLVDGSKLRITYNSNTPQELAIESTRAEAQGDAPIAFPLNLQGSSAASRTLRVTVGTDVQTVVLPDADGQQRSDVLTALNDGISGASVTMDNSGVLTIKSDAHGLSAQVIVEPRGTFGFTSLKTATGRGVPNLSAVTASAIDALIQDNNILQGNVEAVVRGGKLVLRTTNTGSTESLEITAVANTDVDANDALGFPAGVVPGQNGGTLTLYVKTSDTDWEDENGVVVAASAINDARFVELSVEAIDADGKHQAHEALGYHSAHPTYIGRVMAMNPSKRVDARESWVAFVENSSSNAFALRRALDDAGMLNTPETTRENRQHIKLRGGTDGATPGSGAWRKALEELLPVEGISIVAAPGSAESNSAQAIHTEVLTFVNRPRAYQIAVLDAKIGASVSEVLQMRGYVDDTRAAIYYPGVVISNPLARPGNSAPAEITLPPSGFICGLYGRNDAERGVHKAPANVIVRGALRFGANLSMGQQEVLNPAGINCLRALSGRGLRLWGARTASSDTEWKYVNVRRYFNYIEASIDRSTQWAVFEPNGPLLWGRIEETLSAFLFNEWKNGALLGSSPQTAFFVRCDRSTMTQSDIDNGRLVCEIGVAVVKPAEFVIFRIGQFTANARQ